MSAYNGLDLLLHRFALSSSTMRRVAFDVDCMLGDTKIDAERPHAPVYVTGLARSGTTILLETLHATGAFAAMTYRNMPFVTAPQLWPRITARQRRDTTRVERAHGDRIEIGFDSPEAFEEPFWTMLTDGAFIRDEGLDPHEIGEKQLVDYRRYVRNVVAASGRWDVRYLAKNNNNVLRIGSLLEAFPDACVLVPFRDPFDHARSLLRQHQRFLNMHVRDPSSLSYMNWLGHFEFGANFKPFLLGPEAQPRDAGETETLDYWLRYWTCAHRHILDIHKDDVVLFDSDHLRREPRRGLERLADRLDLEHRRLTEFADRITPAEGSYGSDPTTGTSRAAVELHAAMRDASLQAG